MIGDFDGDGTNFPNKLLLANRQIANLCKAFANYLSTDVKLPKTQLSRWYNQENFLVNFFVHY